MSRAAQQCLGSPPCCPQQSAMQRMPQWQCRLCLRPDQMLGVPLSSLSPLPSARAPVQAEEEAQDRLTGQSSAGAPPGPRGRRASTPPGGPLRRRRPPL
ncbi:hypothetical protein AALO_G00032520 [Alosa alosa]|uniref:Uncharacterized protein n=1 Tax=Alosa alosa TaxID=278164 RepID=A0AAV6HCH5_9TELE|nr:hypothetical protein AALO_G00032520 [Alosa alosa]